MYERFTDRARKVMQLANSEAQKFNHEYVDLEHILLGIAKEGSGMASTVLKNIGCDLRQIRYQVEKLMTDGPDMVTMGKLPQTARAKKVIEESIRFAMEWNNNYIGTEHLLAAVCTVGSEALAPCGIEQPKVLAEIHKVQTGMGKDWNLETEETRIKFGGMTFNMPVIQVAPSMDYSGIVDKEVVEMFKGKSALSVEMLLMQVYLDLQKLKQPDYKRMESNLELVAKDARIAELEAENRRLRGEVDSVLSDGKPIHWKEKSGRSACGITQPGYWHTPDLFLVTCPECVAKLDPMQKVAADPPTNPHSDLPQGATNVVHLYRGPAAMKFPQSYNGFAGVVCDSPDFPRFVDDDKSHVTCPACLKIMAEESKTRVMADGKPGGCPVDMKVIALPQKCKAPEYEVPLHPSAKADRIQIGDPLIVVLMEDGQAYAKEPVDGDVVSIYASANPKDGIVRVLASDTIKTFSAPTKGFSLKRTGMSAEEAVGIGVKAAEKEIEQGHHRVAATDKPEEKKDLPRGGFF